MSPLDDLVDATMRRTDAELAWRAAIVAAVQAGEPVARVARVAGITRPTVYSILAAAE